MGTNYPRCSTQHTTVCCPCRGEGCCRCTVGSSARSTRRVAEGDGEDEDDGRAPSVLPCGANVCQRGERRKRSALSMSTSTMHNQFCWRARATFACCLPLKSSPPPPPPLRKIPSYPSYWRTLTVSLPALSTISVQYPQIKTPTQKVHVARDLPQFL